MKRPPIVAYVLSWEENCTLYECKHKSQGTCLKHDCPVTTAHFRWIEHNFIAFRQLSIFEAEGITPMGGDWKRIGPYVVCDNRRQMMAMKAKLNAPHIADACGYEKWQVRREADKLSLKKHGMYQGSKAEQAWLVRQEAV